jgi:hypothetical protein
MNNRKIEFIETANKLKENGLVWEGVNKGSISYRMTDDTFLISPSKLDYCKLTEENINIMKTDGSFTAQPSPISRDSYFHLGIYNTYPNVRAVIHTHSKYATALSLANKPIPFITVGMKFHCGGAVDIAPFAMPMRQLPHCWVSCTVAGQFVGVGLLALFGSAVIAIPSVIPLFFGGCTLGVFANAWGGWKGVVGATFIMGIVTICGSAGLAYLVGTNFVPGHSDWSTLWLAVIAIYRLLFGMKTTL